MHGFFATCKVFKLPVFEPNEYFWKNHWIEGKGDKWEAFANAVRDIIATSGNFTLSDSSMEDKVEYIALTKGKKFDRKA